MAKTKRRRKKAGGVSKMSAVRQALEKLGYEAKPTDILEYVKQNFGVEMSSSMVSNYKAILSKKATGNSTAPAAPKGKRGRKPGSVSTKGISLQDIQMVKELADRIGLATLRNLTKLLG